VFLIDAASNLARLSAISDTVIGDDSNRGENRDNDNDDEELDNSEPTLIHIVYGKQKDDAGNYRVGVS
jgi:hypothetical protein